MQELLERVKTREAERAYLMAQLEVWAGAKAQGIDSDTVRRFGFDSRLLTRKQRRRLSDYLEAAPTGERRPRWLNCAWLHDGTQVQLDPMLKPARRPDNV